MITSKTKNFKDVEWENWSEVPADVRQTLRNRKTAQESRINDYKNWHLTEHVMQQYKERLVKMAEIVKQKLEERGMHETSKRIAERLSKKLVPIDNSAEQFWKELAPDEKEVTKSEVSVPEVTQPDDTETDLVASSKRSSRSPERNREKMASSLKRWKGTKKRRNDT